MPKVPPFFVVEGPIEPGRSVALDPRARRHARARRLGIGDAVRVVDGSGAEGEGTIERLARDACEVRVGAVRSARPRAGIALFVAAIRPPRLAWLVEKATELGASAVTIVASERSQRGRVEGSERGLERLLRVAREAAEQSGQPSAPAIAGPIPEAEAMGRAPAFGAAILLDPSGEPFPAALEIPVALWIGPEGGWSADERERAASSGWRRARLPGGTLRAETAAIAALVLAARAIDTAARGSGQ